MNVTRFKVVMSSLFISALSINSAVALPIDWTGVFGVDTHLISNIRRTSDTVVRTQPNPSDPSIQERTGTQGLAGKNGANFQTYIFKLQPQIIVNDGVTLKGEFSSGYIRGGFLGGEGTNGQDNFPSNAYFFSTPAQRSGLNVNQLYMELYADTALIKIGRMAKHYGLGIVFDGGTDPWDRFFSMYDGIEAEMKIGNFSLIPYWAKISSYDEATFADRPAGDFDVREMGLVAKYDNKNRDLLVSILYAKRSSEPRNTFYTTNTIPATAPSFRGSTDVTVIEPFVSKRWDRFTVAAEASLQTGEFGNVYGTGSSDYAANAFVLEAKYELNPKWLVGLNAGQVDGDDGDRGKFEGMALHPNYHVAELMFRYNYAAFNDGQGSIFDSSITNARYFKLFGNYKTDKWNWKAAGIMANALASAGPGPSYHHEERYAFNGNAEQDKNMGFEFDVGFDYRWNPNVTISGYYGYWFVGDYYAFSNTATELSLQNVHGGGLSATLDF